MVIKIIWAALFFVSLFYGVVGFMVTRVSFDASQLIDLSAPMFYPFTAFAVAAVALAWVLPSFLIRNARIKAGARGPDPVTAYIIRYALLLSVSLYGMVVAILSHNGNHAIPFVLVSAISFLVSIPL